MATVHINLEDPEDKYSFCDVDTGQFFTASHFEAAGYGNVDQSRLYFKTSSTSFLDLEDQDYHTKVSPSATLQDLNQDVSVTIEVTD